SMPGEAEYAAPTIAAPPAVAAAQARALAPVEPQNPSVVDSRALRDRVESMLPDARPAAAAAAVEPIEVAIAPPALPPAPVLAPARVPASTPVTRGSGADPAPPSDSESDAFSVLGSAQFRGGRVTVQSGRQVKTRRPR